MGHDSIRIKGTATVANVSCGFDCLGYAITDPGDILTITKTGNSEITISISGFKFESIPTIPEKNTASSPGGIGNYISIMNLFKFAVDKNLEYIVLMEDDQLLVDDFKNKFQKCVDDLLSLNKSWDILFFASHESISRTKVIKKGLNIRLPFQDDKSKNVYGNNGYLIKKSTMKKILKYAYPIIEASDVFIIGMGKNPHYESKNWPKVFNYYTAYPYILEQLKTISLIGHDK